MNNPCSIKEPVNTALCETLPSQIENFTLNFFGEVFKTEVNGQVQWSLPGRLDVGLTLNPRGATEPLGCYLLRLFQTGVVGAQGIQGEAGVTGCNGTTPYVQVLAGGFPQPSVDAVFSATVSRNHSIRPGEDVFIEGSGWYEIITSNGLGNVTLALRKAVVNPGTWVNQGTTLLPSGKVGDRGGVGVQGIQGVQGNKGVKGDQGNQGAQGVPGSDAAVRLPLTQANIPTWNFNWPTTGFEYGYEGGFSASAFSNVVLFPGAVPCTVTLPTAGTYLLLARCGEGFSPFSAGPGLTGVLANPGINIFRLKNISTNTVLSQSTVRIYSSSMIATFATTLTPNNVIQVQAEALVGAAVVSVPYFWAFKIS